VRCDGRSAVVQGSGSSEELVSDGWVNDVDQRHGHWLLLVNNLNAELM